MWFCVWWIGRWMDGWMDGFLTWITCGNEMCKVQDENAKKMNHGRSDGKLRTNDQLSNGNNYFAIRISIRYKVGKYHTHLIQRGRRAAHLTYIDESHESNSIHCNFLNLSRWTCLSFRIFLLLESFSLNYLWYSDVGFPLWHRMLWHQPQRIHPHVVFSC